MVNGSEYDSIGMEIIFYIFNSWLMSYADSGSVEDSRFANTPGNTKTTRYVHGLLFEPFYTIYIDNRRIAMKISR